MADETAAAAPPRGAVALLASMLAHAGGAVLLATALLTSVSVLKRWATNQPVPGDFELVSLGSGLAVAGFLAYGTLLRTNILVDTFTGWMPQRLARGVDAFWTLVWAGVAAVLAERLFVGARGDAADRHHHHGARPADLVGGGAGGARLRRDGAGGAVLGGAAMRPRLMGGRG